MSEIQWEVVDEVAGDLQAELLRGLLEARGIEAWLSQEGIGHSVYPVTVGPLSKVQILVPSEQSQTARMILEEYYSGKLDDIDLKLPPEESPPDQG